MPCRGACGELLDTGCIRLPRAARSDCILQPEQQTIEVTGYDFRGIDGDGVTGIREPARAEIPTALRGCPNIPEQLRRRAVARARKVHVLRVGFIARSVAIVPIAVEDRSVGHGDHASMPCPGP